MTRREPSGASRHGPALDRLRSASAQLEAAPARLPGPAPGSACYSYHRSDAAKRTRPPMTYCVGILVEEGLVMIADTRTNAGLDDISTYRKLSIIAVPGERVLVLASAGNLSLSQSVVSVLKEGLENSDTGEIETLQN